MVTSTQQPAPYEREAEQGRDDDVEWGTAERSQHAGEPWSWPSSAFKPVRDFRGQTAS
jgi:hypothetical protein